MTLEDLADFGRDAEELYAEIAALDAESKRNLTLDRAAEIRRRVLELDRERKALLVRLAGLRGML